MENNMKLSETLSNQHSNLNINLNLKEDKSNKGQPNGYASLDQYGKVLSSQLNVSASSAKSFFFS
jgi:hypothetical protein